MDTTKKWQMVLPAMGSVFLMMGGGFLFNHTLNVLYGTSPALLVLLLSMFSVSLYIIGAALMGRCIKKRNQWFTRGINNGVSCALLIVAIGILLLGFNLEHFPFVWKDFLFSLPMLVFVAGIVQLCQPYFRNGFIISLTGVFLLFSKASVLYPDIKLYEQFISTFWPVLIILVGVAILLSAIFPELNKARHRKARCNDNTTPNQSENNDGKINYNLTFSGTEQVLLDPVFKGGNIDITFGGMELDLKRTSLAEGDTYLYVKVVFGGIEITAPDHWDIEIRQNRFAGGIEDSRVKGFEKDKTRKLIIVAKCTFGGIDIK